MTAALCSGGGSVCATRGNLNNEIGLPLSLLTLGAETAYGIFEVGTNHPGEIAVLADVLRPEIALISSIGSAHIEHFGSQEAIAFEKGELLRALPSDGAAVLCHETACFERLAACAAAPLVTTSLVTRDADFYGEPLDLLAGRIRVSERATGAEIELCCGLPGEHNASNLLLAFAAARTAGVSAADAAEGLACLTLPEMRWAVSKREGVTVVNDAYNANPQSMRAAAAAASAAARPDMLDRNGEVLATDVRVMSIFAEPRRIIDKDEATELLTAVLPDVDARELRDKLGSRKGFVWVKREVSPKQQQEVYRLGLPGVVPGLTPPAGRLEKIGGHNEPLVVVDYAHTPDALENALRALRPVASDSSRSAFTSGTCVSSAPCTIMIG